MSDKSKIEWTDSTWNPVTGCSRVSEGCRNCYAERLAGTRLAQTPREAGVSYPKGLTPALTAYRKFIESKIQLDSGCGFRVEPGQVNPALKPFTRDIVRWACEGGRRAIFSSFGLHKTCTQIEAMRLIGHQDRGRPRLIVAPLGVRQEFKRDAEQFFQGEYAVDLRFVRTDAEIGDLAPIYLTNYESIREGKIDPREFDVSLDEASCLRGLGGTKTFREFMRIFEGSDSWRFVASATPSPNEFIELLAYAAFLDVMDVGQAKTRFFKRNSEKADKLTIHPHKEREFWLWVASWALFVQKPSDLGYSDEGYEMPPLKVRWHELPSDHQAAGFDNRGQGRLLKSTAIGVQQAAAEKRDSLPQRIEKLKEIIGADPLAHRLIWHDLEDERRAIEQATPEAVSVYGVQDLDERERAIIDFSEGRLKYLAAKPVMLGSGCNFQRHCSKAVFLGIGFKFNDFIQAVHRIQRFLQTRECEIDIIYTEAERDVKHQLERKWAQHRQLVENMTGIIREYGLSRAAMAGALSRSVGVERREASGKGWTLVNNDCVEECLSLPADSAGLILTSVPFATQYEYTPSYNDFGHTDDNDHFWAQMDFLTPELYRILAPGRVAAIHVKDRVTPGGINGFGFQTVQPFSDECVAHFRKHGFAFLARKTVVTDVVRENAQTYRLGWTEQCKDGSRMGCGMPEYVLLFRKPPTDRSNGYADVPVVKDKAEYSRARWQFDAHGFMRSSGDRLLMPEDLKGLPHNLIFKLFRRHSLERVYDFEHDVKLAEYLDAKGMLPPSFMLLQPQSWHPDVWTDVARMRSLNMVQAQRGQEMHLCPLQFDICDRVIRQFTNEGDLVMDPFAGIGSVPLRALLLGRQGLGVELNGSYWEDAVAHLRRAEERVSIPALFDLDAVEPEPILEVPA
jgi:hypothetical protein